MSLMLQADGKAQVLRALDPARFERVIRRALRAVALHIKGKITEYPPLPGGRPQFPHGFVSDRQRRYFFAALRSGEIEVPYRRGQSPKSEAHAQSWTVKVKASGDEATVGSDTSYGPYLQQAGVQSRYHEETGWKTDEQVVKEETEAAMRLFNRFFAQELSRGV
jgi:hypothetical protein